MLIESDSTILISIRCKICEISAWNFGQEKELAAATIHCLTAWSRVLIEDESWLSTSDSIFLMQRFHGKTSRKKPRENLKFTFGCSYHPLLDSLVKSADWRWVMTVHFRLGTMRRSTTSGSARIFSFLIFNLQIFDATCNFNWKKNCITTGYLLYSLTVSPLKYRNVKYWRS